MQPFSAQLSGGFKTLRNKRDSYTYGKHPHFAQEYINAPCLSYTFH